MRRRIMKIAQYYHKDQIRLGLIDDDFLIPTDFQGGMIDYIKNGNSLKPEGSPIPLGSIQFAPAVSNPPKIIAIGLNYLDHIEESRGEAPKNPLVFAKFSSSLIGHNEHITWDPGLTTKVDFEAELAVVIGKTAYNCPEIETMEKIFGYTCANDVTARDLQFGDGQWVRGKSLDTFCPLGPWIVSSDDIQDPHSLGIKCSLNGQIMQESNTGMMMFKLPQLISFLSKNFTLLPGDIILTGTPHGVGSARNPAIFLKDGDEIVVEIKGIGRLANICKTL
jgi:2-keto-4-pentenoate hydratase/2-oxohepta-3-ene-1,7-dioic acid hydratase in catechol pathway